MSEKLIPELIARCKEWRDDETSFFDAACDLINDKVEPGLVAANDHICDAISELEELANVCPDVETTECYPKALAALRGLASGRGCVGHPEGCKYLGSNIWDCGTVDQEPIGR